jgi:thioredoxin 1
MEPKKTFSELIRSEKPVLVDFFATWCGPCQMMKPILKELSEKVGDQATIIQVDVDKNPRAASAYRVQGVPTLILFKKGEVLWRQSGVVPTYMLENIIRQHAVAEEKVVG